jgi:hypothetical protein
MIDLQSFLQELLIGGVELSIEGVRLRVRAPEFQHSLVIESQIIIINCCELSHLFAETALN